ncbi:MAG: DUF2461 domain-containing protein [Bacteroidota bacterium]
MLQKSTQEFLIELNENNHKAWFDENRKKYEAAKQDFELFISEVLVSCTPLIPELEGRKAKDCIFRIFKDVRFSKDKVPYKNNFGAAFGKGDKKAIGGGFYIHFQPGNHNFVGGGIWMPEANSLKAIRQEIDYSFTDFKAIIHKPSFRKMFGDLDQSEKLKKCPKDYTDDNPALEYLKLKSFTVGTALTDKEMMGKDAVSKITTIVKEMKPFIDFLDKAVG